MSNVILYIATSLDGYIAKTDHDLSWLSTVKRKDEDYGYQAFMKNVDSIIMGNRSFEIINQFGQWPYPDKQCFVASHALSSYNNENVQFITDPAAQISRLKKANKGNIWLLGGADIADSLLRLNLVDELIISTIPVMLGSGIRLFNAPLPEMTLKLLSSTSFDSGLVQSHYKITACH